MDSTILIFLSWPIDPFDCFHDSTHSPSHPSDDDDDDDRLCFGSPLLVCGLKRDFNDDCPCERFLNHVFSESMYASMITMSE